MAGATVAPATPVVASILTFMRTPANAMYNTMRNRGDALAWFSTSSSVSDPVTSPVANESCKEEAAVATAPPDVVSSSAHTLQCDMVWAAVMG